MTQPVALSNRSQVALQSYLDDLLFDATQAEAAGPVPVEPLAEPAPAEAVRPLERWGHEGVQAVGVREPAQPATALPTWAVPETPKAEPAKPVDVPREPQPAVSLNQPAVVLTLAQVARAATSLGVQPAELLRKLAATGAISDAELARLLPPLEG